MKKLLLSLATASAMLAPVTPAFAARYIPYTVNLCAQSPFLQSLSGINANAFHQGDGFCDDGQPDYVTVDLCEVAPRVILMPGFFNLTAFIRSTGICR